MPAVDLPNRAICRCSFPGSAPWRDEVGKWSVRGSTSRSTGIGIPQFYRGDATRDKGSQGRVVRFEQVLCRFIARFGFGYVLAKVAPALYCDTELRAAFGYGLQSTEANAIACLRSYIHEVRSLPIDLLMSGP